MSFDVEAAYRKHGPMVRRRCAFLLKDNEAARDATQEVFVVLVVHAKRFDETGSSRLLWTIATRVCLNRLRTKRRHPEEHVDDDVIGAIAGADDTFAAVATSRVLDAIFGGAALKADTRTLAVMHWVDGMTLEETAESSGMSVSGVRKRLRTLQERVAKLSRSEALA
jgi:RNA polymerase sigma-70 factor, ECF subfamily